VFLVSYPFIEKGRVGERERGGERDISTIED